MNSHSAEAPTELLERLRRGDRSALEVLLPLVYEHLHAVARNLFRGQPPGHTLQPTALVHEAYLRLVGARNLPAESRAHFLAVAARAMRQILTDSARRRAAGKRGGGRAAVSLDSGLIADTAPPIDPVELDDALTRLAELDERQSQIVELRFFGGLTVGEVARVLEVSTFTVENDWRMARAWLSHQLSQGPDS